MKPIVQAMLYMPLLHAEDGQLQERSLKLFGELHEEAKSKGLGSVLILERFSKIAARHHQVIGLFGRFPERNKYLGRRSNTQEAAYLAG